MTADLCQRLWQAVPSGLGPRGATSVLDGKISADLRGFRLLLGRGKRAPYLGLLGAWASPRYREMQHRGGDMGDHETRGSERYFSALNDPAILIYYPPRSSNFPST